jgi:phage terminase small subunit
MAPKRPKPTMQLVGTSFHRGPIPPRPLGKEGRACWDRMVDVFDYEENQLEQLVLACEQIDRAEELAEAIRRDGVLITRSNGSPRENPLLKLETASRALAARLLSKLEPKRPYGLGRPPRRYPGPGGA